jgi:hypothetical protein
MESIDEFMFNCAVLVHVSAMMALDNVHTKHVILTENWLETHFFLKYFSCI